MSLSLNPSDTLAMDVLSADLLPRIVALAQRAGDMALDYYRPGARTTAHVEAKEGGSPVTAADHALDAFLRTHLGAVLPDTGWLSEETLDTPERLGKERLFIVDPIDGTRAFMSGDPRWGISIALAQAGMPRLGVLHMPALGETYTALAQKGAWLNGRPLQVSGIESLAGAKLAGPVPLIERFVQASGPVQTQKKVPSLAYRIALVASGAIDAGLASTNAHDWDIAAADLIVHEAGGFLADSHGQRPVYNKPSTQHGILAAAPARFRDEITAILRTMS